MNANELADELEDCEPYNIKDTYLLNTAATMLRQQQFEIEMLRNQVWHLKSEPWGFDRKAQEK